MEKRINQQLEAHWDQVKTHMREVARQQHLEEDPRVTTWLMALYSYPPLQLTADDVSKRKKLPEISIRPENRCLACRADRTQCTRRRRGDPEKFCGTHQKGTPHGECAPSQWATSAAPARVEVWTHKFDGVPHFIDAVGNVYDTEEIVRSVPHPSVIGHYTQHDGVYRLTLRST
jgi:hypothetical protein